jgi:hypothetical protein
MEQFARNAILPDDPRAAERVRDAIMELVANSVISFSMASNEDGSERIFHSRQLLIWKPISQWACLIPNKASLDSFCRQNRTIT